MSPAPIQVNDRACNTLEVGLEHMQRHTDVAATPAHMAIRYLRSGILDCKARTPRVIQMSCQDNIWLCGTSPWAVWQGPAITSSLNKNCSILCFCVLDGTAPSPINLQRGDGNKANMQLQARATKKKNHMNCLYSFKHFKGHIRNEKEASEIEFHNLHYLIHSS